jgi:hypothetical protein
MKAKEKRGETHKNGANIKIECHHFSHYFHSTAIREKRRMKRERKKVTSRK